MHYIERVLPSLGETGVVMASLGRLMPGIHAVPEQDPDVAALKGKLNMADVIANAVANRQRTPAEDRILEVDSRKLTLSVRQVRRARDRARATGKPHNEARVTFVKILLRELTEQLTEIVEESNIGNNADRSYLAEDVRSARDVRIVLNLCWMPMTPEKLVSELFSKPAILEACTRTSRRRSVPSCFAPRMHRGRKPMFRCSTRPLNSSASSILPRAGDWPSKNTTVPATSLTPSRHWSTWRPWASTC
ncbi:atp-Dependent DNA helicase [Arthrobacter sp. Hiyo8]|nr:atp-Dependent DNA helicase [Arthrobacter sp. Hiyo8]